LMFKLCHFNFFFTSTCSTLPCPLLNLPKNFKFKAFYPFPLP
jgi:hypothetical protein